MGPSQGAPLTQKRSVMAHRRHRISEEVPVCGRAVREAHGRAGERGVKRQKGKRWGSAARISDGMEINRVYCREDQERNGSVECAGGLRGTQLSQHRWAAVTHLWPQAFLGLPPVQCVSYFPGTATPIRLYTSKAAFTLQGQVSGYSKPHMACKP